MKIFNQNWHKAFLPWVLNNGKELSDNGSVVDIKQEKRKIQARLQVQVREKINVTIELGENEDIYQIKCANKSCENVCYCKHCAAVLWKLYPFEDEEWKKDLFLNPNEGVASNLPRSASPKEKLDDIIIQLRNR